MRRVLAAAARIDGVVVAIKFEKSVGVKRISLTAWRSRRIARAGPS